MFESCTLDTEVNHPLELLFGGHRHSLHHVGLVCSVDDVDATSESLIVHLRDLVVLGIAVASAHKNLT